MIRCRACLSDQLHAFLPLGMHPPANAFLTAAALAREERVYPLDSLACLVCGLVQVIDQLPPDFFRDYVYVPSAATTMHDHFRRFAEAVARDIDRRAGASPLVVDIGCNDGLFLSACRDAGLRVLGIDPATNIIEMARERGIEVFNEYFGSVTAVEAYGRWGAADIITTTNTFNHIDSLHDFTKGVTTLLAQHGTFIVEVPQALTYVEWNEFDTIYHEHLSVSSVESFVRLGAHFDLEVVRVTPLAVHGGSMRVYLRRVGAPPIDVPAAERPDVWRARERAAGLFEAGTYDAMAARVQRIRVDTLRQLHALKAAGKRIAGYGAPAKGNTLLNYFGIGTDLLDFLVDRNPLKQGLFSPGMHIPILGPEAIAERAPDVLLVLAWNFKDEIFAQQQEFSARGGRFLVPIPEPVLV